MPLRFVPPVWDRLVQDDGAAIGGTSWTLCQLKEGIARDLQALFNTRSVWKEDAIGRYPQLARSVLNFGLPDFTHLSMSSSDDRNTVCAAMKLAIERFEPRLCGVRVALEVQAAPYRLLIAISATLNVRQATEPILFDAFLDPTSQKYSIRHGAPLIKGKAA
jgi:type VI secretion system protein ImpF